MAFYADVYGYIARKEAEEIPTALIVDAFRSSPGFKPRFSVSASGRAAYYNSFACNVKLDDGEDGLWLAPFEAILRGTNFLSASVTFVHEWANHIMMYSYVKDGLIKRFSSKLTEQFVEKSTI